MKLIFQPSLENMAAVKIATTLWNQNDIKDLISKVDFTCQTKTIMLKAKQDMKEIEKKVFENIKQLPLPELMGKKLYITKYIGRQIFKWMIFHNCYFEIPLNLPAELPWTPQGTIDIKKAAEMLVKDDMLDISTRFKIACLYCFEDYIRKFQTLVNEDLKCSRLGLCYRGKERLHLGSIHDIKENFFECARSGNTVSTEYFLQKLSPEERPGCLVFAAKSMCDAKMMYFLLTKMEQEQQIETLKFCPERALMYFLDWPLQNFFIKIADCVWDYFTANVFDLILKRISKNVSKDYMSYNYIFTEFWKKSPTSFKNVIIDNFDKTDVLESLFNAGDKENTKLILRDATDDLKRKFIYKDLTRRYLLAVDEDFFKFLIKECLSSRDEIKQYQKYFIECYEREHYFILVGMTEKWGHILVWFNDLISKERYVEGESSSSERSCK